MNEANTDQARHQKPKQEQESQQEQQEQQEQQSDDDRLQDGGPSTNDGQVPDGLEGSIMEPGSERDHANNAGKRPAGDERRIDDL